MAHLALRNLTPPTACLSIFQLLCLRGGLLLVTWHRRPLTLHTAARSLRSCVRRCSGWGMQRGSWRERRRGYWLTWSGRLPSER